MDGDLLRDRERDLLLHRKIPLGTTSSAAFEQKASTELSPLGRGPSEPGGLFGGGGGGEFRRVATLGLHVTLVGGR